MHRWLTIGRSEFHRIAALGALLVAAGCGGMPVSEPAESEVVNRVHEIVAAKDPDLCASATTNAFLLRLGGGDLAAGEASCRASVARALELSSGDFEVDVVRISPGESTARVRITSGFQRGAHLLLTLVEGDNRLRLERIKGDPVIGPTAEQDARESLLTNLRELQLSEDSAECVLRKIRDADIQIGASGVPVFRGGDGSDALGSVLKMAVGACDTRRLPADEVAPFG